MSDDAPRKTAVIAGAGPAGLTAALELLRRSDIVPLVFEADDQVGGISKTVRYRGNRLDLGGHRFFSKSDWVMRWWQEILPLADDQPASGAAVRLAYQGTSAPFSPTATASASRDDVLLVRQRLSRIFHRRRFFDYPLKLDAATLGNMGVAETFKVGLSYGRACLAPLRPETTLEDFFINRFGDRLYRTFFKDYTEKVWGVPCRDISAEWGSQRIKGLSISKALAHAVTTPLRRAAHTAPWRSEPAGRMAAGRATAQRRTETSLIESFLYPKFGPGQMWEEVARRVIAGGGEVHLRQRIVGIERTGTHVDAVIVRDHVGADRRVACDHFISTMPVRDLTALLQPSNPRVVQIAERLPYRDFMTAGLLLRRMRPRGAKATASPGNGMPPDNWIYIQEPDVRIGRLQVFNNWSPAMVADPATIWLGLEYFCGEGDDLWSMEDGRFVDFAAAELEQIGLIDRRDVLDGTLVRLPKAYPAYFGEYREFGQVRAYLDQFINVYPVGRNGMHRYNNQDHSMLAANAAVDAILHAGRGKADIWRINAEGDYHEEADHVA